MTHALVDRKVLERLLKRAYHMGLKLHGEVSLSPDDELVSLAVQAGLLIPGPLDPGKVPPPPPHRRFRGGVPLAGLYRAEGDPRIRCMEDAKVVYGTMREAEHAAALISQRRVMRAYQGMCGHYHVARVK